MSRKHRWRRGTMVRLVQYAPQRRCARSSGAASTTEGAMHLEMVQQAPPEAMATLCKELHQVQHTVVLCTTARHPKVPL